MWNPVPDCLLDNVFHRVIICLERLELFLAAERFDGTTPSFQQTAMNTDRDLHDDNKNPPSIQSYFGELELQVLCLNIQIGSEVHDVTIKYLYNDLLEWYGGRDEYIPYSEVDAAIIPIMFVINHQCDSKELVAIYEKYVAKTNLGDDFSDEHRKEIIGDLFFRNMEIIRLDNIQMCKDIDDDKISLTRHRRGDAICGYKRIVDALTTLFDDPIPAKTFVHTCYYYLPEIVSHFPSITEDSIEKIAKMNHTKRDKEYECL